MAVNGTRRLPILDEEALAYEHPLFGTMLSAPGLSVATAPLSSLLSWGMKNSLWVFPMATSCCGIELMAAAASRVDLDRMGTIVRATPRQADVMVIAGTITVKMAPRVLALWKQMPEPKWAIAMGSCAISGDFYRNLYAVVPGIDTVIPVDVYIPGCPPNPEALMHGLMRLQEKIEEKRQGRFVQREPNPALLDITKPAHNGRVGDPARDAELSQQQEDSAWTCTSFDRDDEHGDRGEAETPAPVVDTPSVAVAEIFASVGVTEFPKDAAPIVETSRHVELARRLRDMGYRQFVYVVATHFPEKTGAKASPERFEVAYAVRTIGKGSEIASWRISLATGEAAPTLVGIYAGADWQEREQYDLVGVSFEGHPDLRRIMLPENWAGHPLRKEYAADTAQPPWR